MAHPLSDSDDRRRGAPQPAAPLIAQPPMDPQAISARIEELKSLLGRLEPASPLTSRQAA